MKNTLTAPLLQFSLHLLNAFASEQLGNKGTLSQLKFTFKCHGKTIWNFDVVYCRVKSKGMMEKVK